jgi:hypothetical protein
VYDCPEDGCVLNGQEIFQVEVEADAKHQQYHADFSELFRNEAVRNKARRLGPDNNSSQEVSDGG